MRKLLLIGLLLCSTSAWAEPITGSLYFTRDEGTFDFNGASLSGAFQLPPILGRYAPLNCLPCTPGQTVSIGGNWMGPDVRGLLTADDQTFPLTGSWASELRSGYGAITMSGSVVVPGTQGAPVSAGVFTLNGWYLFPDEFHQGTWTTQKIFAGTGTVLVQWMVGLEPGWNFQNASYEFAGEAPEPATVLLVSSGLLFALRRRYGRTHAGTQ